MFASLVLVWLAVGGYGAAAPWLARRLPPLGALALLVGGGLVATAAALGSLAVVVVSWLCQLPPAAAVGSWSADLVADDDPYPVVLTVLAGVGLALVCGRAVVRGTVVGRRLHETWLLAASCADSDLVVVDDASTVAYALPGRRRGRTVVSSGLLRRLDGGGRQAVLAHERAHLRWRHDLVGLCAAVTAAANPLLRDHVEAVELACERQADAAAARAVGSPSTVAAAIAVAAGVRAPAGTAAASGADVPQRVAALLRPAGVRTGVAAALPLLTLLAAAGAAFLWLGHDLDQILHAARAAM